MNRSQSRRLAAIMFTDIFGFTTLMGSDEEKTFEIMEKNRQLHKTVLNKHNGQWIKEIGDAILTTFDTVSDAVRAAIEIQEECQANQDYQLRIGIHQGEVVFENNDVFGDGVNIASRIQTSSEPSTIFVSETVYKNISNKKGIKTHFVKEANLKNVSHPVRIYQVLFSGSEIVGTEKPVTPVIENSIAVLPFVNMSNNPNQEYFSDGISEEIINVLAQVPDFMVTGRTSSFAFKGNNMDLKVIGEQLNVNFLLEGSVRMASNKIRVTAQLIKASTGFHLFSENYDRILEDIFDIQDEISLAILNSVKRKILPTDKKIVLKKYTDNFEAYEAYLKGRYHVNNFTRDEFLKAIEYFDLAISIAPNYAIAHAARAFCYMNIYDFNWMPSEIARPKAIKSAFKALELDDEIADSYLAVGRIKLHWEWKLEEALVLYQKALRINPNSAEIHVQLGLCLTMLERDQEAKEHASKALEIDPLSILNIWYASASFLLSDFDKTIANGKRSIALAPNFFSGYLITGWGYMGLKKYDQAIEAFETTVKFGPGAYNYCYLGMAYGLKGEKSKALEVIEILRAFDDFETAGNYSVAFVYSSIGEFDKAFTFFNKSVDVREGAFIIWAKRIIQLYVPEMMNDPRSKDLFKRLGLPD